MAKTKKKESSPRQHPEKEEGQKSRGRGVWSGTIGFGLVSIPVQLFPAVRPRGISLRMLGPNGEPLKRRYYDPESGKELERGDLIRGYQLSEGGFVPLEQEELEGVSLDKSDDIELIRFVDASQIDPMYFERAYFLVPNGSSNKAYRLLAETMERTKRAGIATFVMRDKEYPIAVLAENGILRAEMLRFGDELRSPEQVGLPEARHPSKEEVRQFVTEIRAKEAPSLELAVLHDSQAERLVDVARRKMKHNRAVVRVEKEPSEVNDNVIDLVQALKRSLRASEADEAKPKTEHAGKKNRPRPAGNHRKKAKSHAAEGHRRALSRAGS